MLFQEKSDASLPYLDNCFVYFLIEKDEVVYVGQTKNGGVRPYQHVGSKDFDRVEIIYCDQDSLNTVEATYIAKYKPKYNCSLKGAGFLGKMQARNMLRNITKHDEYSLHNLKRDMKELGFEFVNLNGSLYVPSDFFLAAKDMYSGGKE